MWAPEDYSLLTPRTEAAAPSGSRWPDAIACALFFRYPAVAGGEQCTADGLGLPPPTAGRCLISDAAAAHRLPLPPAWGGDDDDDVRCAVFLWRRADAEWVGWEAWAKKMAGNFDASMCAMTPRQRGMLGWPLPHAPYWSRDGGAAVAETAQRYGPALDMAPYSAPPASL